MPIQLKNGITINDPRVDRVYQLDWRSLDYLITHKLADALNSGLITNLPINKRWDIGGPLDQGQNGACVGFSSAHKLLSKPTPETTDLGEPVDATFALQKIYWEAQKIDEWPGGSYPGADPKAEGTSVLAAAKVLKSDGIIDAYHWAVDVSQVALGVMYDGPCVFACTWYDNMFTPDPQGFVTPGGAVAGGHAILIYGIQLVPLEASRSLTWSNIDWTRSYFELENSWGANWGLGGKFRLRGDVLSKLLNDQGEACFYHKETVVAPTPPLPQPTPPQPQPAPPATVAVQVGVDTLNKQVVLVTKEASPRTVRMSVADAAGMIADLNTAVSQLS